MLKEVLKSIVRNTLQHSATHCNSLQHPATHCNTLQHPSHDNKSIKSTDWGGLSARASLDDDFFGGWVMEAVLSLSLQESLSETSAFALEDFLDFLFFLSFFFFLGSSSLSLHGYHRGERKGERQRATSREKGRERKREGAREGKVARERECEREKEEVESKRRRRRGGVCVCEWWLGYRRLTFRNHNVFLSLSLALQYCFKPLRKVIPCTLTVYPSMYKQRICQKKRDFSVKQK